MTQELAKPCIDWNEITEICGGTWLLEPLPTQGIEGVYDDSRAVTDGALFVAIAGELTDGNRYLVKAAQNGAACVVASSQPSQETLELLRTLECACVLVPDGMAAFHALAGAYRRRYEMPLVGVTGSCGKTSSKEMVAAVLERKFGAGVVKTEGNTNNYFGVPRNLFRLNERTPAAVIEMGSNHPGEIHRLAGMVRPTVGLVCNIGAAHLEFFKDLRGVANEKGSLFEALPQDSVAIMPGEATGLDILKAKAGNRRIVTFGASAENDVRGEYLGLVEGGYGVRLTVRKTGEAVTFTWGIGGAHQALNAAGATAVGLTLGMSLAEIVEGLKNCQLPGARMKVEVHNGVNWVNDCYNANPSSMRASLEWFRDLTQGKRRVLVLGEMKELGDCSAQAHQDILAYVGRELPEARVIAVGPGFAEAAKQAGYAYFERAAQARDAVEGTFQQEEWVLVKGSNSVGLDCLIPKD